MERGRERERERERDGAERSGGRKGGSEGGTDEIVIIIVYYFFQGFQAIKMTAPSTIIRIGKIQRITLRDFFW